MLACGCVPAPYLPTLVIVPSPSQFKAWLARHGPFGAVIDGANVALYGQNFDTGGFNFGQIQAVVNHLASHHPDLKPLLVLHVGRTKAPQVSLAHVGWQPGPALRQRLHEAAPGWGGCVACLGCDAATTLPPLPLPSLQAKTAEAQALLKELSDAHSFYVTPAGSNDDWWVGGWVA
jgi:proteinaceous RNase P